VSSEEAGQLPGRLIVHIENCRGCRDCQLACSFTRHGSFNPDKSLIVMERNLPDARTAPMIKPIGCNLCGGNPACARACQYGAITYEQGPSFDKVVVRVPKGEPQ
jgi:anaerobic carbon-monoxide dehydrogenase iron sulfur subunit